MPGGCRWGEGGGRVAGGCLADGLTPRYPLTLHAIPSSQSRGGLRVERAW